MRTAACVQVTNSYKHMSYLQTTTSVWAINNYAPQLSPWENSTSYISSKFNLSSSLILCQFQEIVSAEVNHVMRQILTGLGGEMVWSACSNGHAMLKDLGLSPTYDQWSFPPVKRFFHSQKSNSNATICAMCPNNLV